MRSRRSIAPRQCGARSHSVHNPGYMGHLVTENRNGLVVDTRLTLSTGTAERDAAIAMMEQKPAGKRLTLGGDRGLRYADVRRTTARLERHSGMWRSTRPTGGARLTDEPRVTKATR